MQRYTVREECVIDIDSICTSLFCFPKLRFPHLRFHSLDVQVQFNRIPSIPSCRLVWNSASVIAAYTPPHICYRICRKVHKSPENSHSITRPALPSTTLPWLPQILSCKPPTHPSTLPRKPLQKGVCTWCFLCLETSGPRYLHIWLPTPPPSNLCPYVTLEKLSLIHIISQYSALILHITLHS